MSTSLPEWAYLVDDTGRCWCRLDDGSKQPAEGKSAMRPPARALYAIPTHDLVSLPQWISSKEDGIIEQVLSAESEKLGLNGKGGPGRVSDWQTVEVNGSSTLVQSVSIPWSLEGVDQGGTEFTGFLPRHALYPPPGDAAVLWREKGEWIAGYSRGERWVHVQPLGDGPEETIAREIGLTLMELSAKDVVAKTDRIVVWAPFDERLNRALQAETGLEVAFSPHPDPVPGKVEAWKLEPHEITLERIAKTKRKRNGWLLTGFVLVLALLVAAAWFHLHLMQKGNARLSARIEANSEAASVIEETMERWDTLGPAIDPKRSPVEIFHRISTLLPEKGVRLTGFELQNHKTITVRAQASNMANALKFKTALEQAPGLADYKWSIPQPREKDDLTELTATGVWQLAVEESDNAAGEE